MLTFHHLAHSSDSTRALPDAQHSVHRRRSLDHEARVSDPPVERCLKMLAPHAKVHVLGLGISICG